MGRPKGYDRQEVLEKAMKLFWLQGYESTSTQELVEHLGINRNSMYSEFGTKQKLFETALKHYERIWLGRNFGPLELPTSGLDDIAALFDHYAKVGKGRRSGLGCMLANAAVERTPVDDGAKNISRRFIERVTRAFSNALQRAQADGDIDASVDVAPHAEFLTSTWLGMLVLARAKAKRRTLDSTARMAKDYVNTLRI